MRLILTTQVRVLLLCLAAGFPVTTMAAAGSKPPRDPAMEIFARKCASCHTVGHGKRVGPDLKGVHSRHDNDWIARFIEAPSRMLDSDPVARDLLTRFKGVRMPDLGLSPEQVAGLSKMLKRCSTEVCDLTPGFVPATKAVETDFAGGRAFFAGIRPLKGGGPPCISCHNVQGAGGWMAGGTLARDLTHAFARLGDAGLDAALKNPAFPVMDRVFADHPLADDEVFALRAFLYNANKSQPAESDTWSVLLAGLLGTGLTIMVLNALWFRRLRGVRGPIAHADQHQGGRASRKAEGKS